MKKNIISLRIGCYIFILFILFDMSEAKVETSTVEGSASNPGEEGTQTFIMLLRIGIKCHTYCIEHEKKYFINIKIIFPGNHV